MRRYNERAWRPFLIALSLVAGCDGSGMPDSGLDSAVQDSGSSGRLDGGETRDGAEMPDGQMESTPSGGTPALAWQASDGDLEHGSRLRITTDGSFDFGAKDQAAPVLVDYVSHAWENGELNEHQRTFADMQRIRRPDEDPDTLWAKPSLGGSETNTGMLYTTSRPHRHRHSDAHYYGAGTNNFLGWPTAYGGSEPDSPSRTLYVSWWCKMPFDLRRYYAIPADAAETGFEVGGDEEYGEEITISGVEGRGRIIGHRTDIGDGTVTEG